MIFREIRLRQGSVRWALLAIVAGNAIVFGSLALDATAHTIQLAALVVYVQAAIAISSLGFGDLDWWLRGTAQRLPPVLGLHERMASVGTITSGTRAAGSLPRKEIRFRDVRFAYGETADPVLDASTSWSPRAPRWRSSAPTAPARPRWPSCSAGSTTRRRAPS
jgi:hypothetical protein